MGAADNITFNDPTGGLTVSATGWLNIDASDYVSHASYTISCGEPKNIGSAIAVSRRGGCNYRIGGRGTAGSASFTVPYISTSGAVSITSERSLSVTVGPASAIFLNGFALLDNTVNLIAAGSQKVVDFSDHLEDGIFTLTCDSVTAVTPDGFLTNRSVTVVSRNGCVTTFSVAAGTAAGLAGFTVSATSSSGTNITGLFGWLRVGAASDLSYSSPPSGLTVGRNRSLTINAADYATDTNYSVWCGAPTNIDSTSFASVAQSGSSCNYTITPDSTLSSGQQGNATFDIPFTSAGGPMVTGTVTVDVGPDSTIDVSVPASIDFQISTSRTVDFSSYAEEASGDWSISCGTASESSSLISLGTATGADGCSIPITAGASTGTGAVVAVPFVSTGGHSITRMFTIDVLPTSDITFNAPPDLKLGINRTRRIDASDYVTEAHGSYLISCGAANNIDITRLASVAQSGDSCFYTITPVSNLAVGSHGAATFEVPYRSSGGDMVNGEISIEVGPASVITYEAPPDLKLGVNRTRVIDASDYVMESESSYAISCGAPANIDTERLASVAQSGSTCGYTITPVSNLMASAHGAADFDIAYTSEGGHIIDGTVSVDIGPASTITFTAPASNPAVAASRVSTIDVSSYARESHSGYGITCGEVTESSALISAVANTGCSVEITTGSSTGTAAITIPYVSDGGHTLSSTLNIEIGAASSITYNGPSSLSVAAGREQVIYASATDGGYVISCGEATGVDSTVLTVTRSGCFFTVAAAASATAGDTTFAVRISSSGGDAHDQTFTATVGPVSGIAFEAPTTPLSVPAGSFRHFDVSGYASDRDYGITCRYPGARHALISRLSFVAPGTTTPTGPATGCNVTVYAGNTAGSASVSVIYNSAGGDEVTGIIPVTIASSSALNFTPPANLGLRVGQTITVNARLYARDGTNTISCGDAEDPEAKITGIVRTNCVYEVTVGDTTGATHFTVPYSSSSGAELKGRIELTISPPRSDISFTAPAGLSVAANGVITIDAADYASDGIFAVSCETITQSHALIASINESGCSIEIRAGSTAGTATFEVPYSSSGGDAHTGQFTLVIGPVPALSAAGCADGTFVDTAANPRMAGSNNDLVEDCQALVAAQNHWAGVSANSDLRSTYFLRTWGTGTAEQQKIDMWEGVTVTGGRVTALEIDNLGEEDGISGTIPAEIGDLAALTTLDISSHQLSGSIPTALGSLTSLTSLDLSGNALSSEIPSQLGSLTALTSLDLSRNSLSGNIPTALGSLTALTSLDLSSNALSGNIPTQLGSLASLTGLYLGSNQLTGDIPAQLGSLSALVSLFLGGNRLTGSVPAQLGTITTLASLSICSNYLTGALPSALRSGVTLLGYDTSDGYNPVACQTASDIQFSAPNAADLVVTTSGMRTIDASSYATDGAYAITCANPTNVSSTLSSVALAAGTCDYTITAGSTPGTGSFTVPYESSGGDTHDGEITVTIAAISFTAPSGLKTGRNRSLRIDASGDASHPGNTISCGAPENIDSDRLMSVAQQGSTCEYIVTPVSSLASSLYGDATFEVEFSSSGSVSIKGTYTIEIGPDSTISFSPPSLKIGRNLTLEIDVLDHADEVNPADYTISCGNPTGIVSSRLEGVTRTGDSCVFTVNPVDTLSTSLQGDTTFTVPLTSTGGHSRDATFTVNIGPDSGITVSPPSSIAIAASRARTVDFSDYAQEDSPSAYSISCAAPTTASNLITIGTPDGCSAEITSGASQGQATVSVEFTSDGGAEATGQFTIDVGAPSSITFGGASSFSVAAGRDLAFFASATDGGYEISCEEATGIDNAKLTSVTRNGCFYTVNAAASATAGDTAFTVRIVSSGGDTHDQTITITVGAASSISFEPPTTPLSVPAGSFRHFDVSGYASDGDYGITCRYPGDTHALVSRLNFAAPGTSTPTGPASGCNVTIYAGDTAGSASLSVIYNSAGGDEATGVIPVRVTSSSALAFSPPRNLSVRVDQTITINARLYARDGLNTITCGDPEAVSNSLTGVARDGCFFTATAGNTAGSASFTVPYTSSSGAELKGRIELTVNEARSSIDFTAPVGLSVATNGIIAIDAADYASDGIYAVSCETITQSHTLIASINESGCSIRLTAGGTAGTATFEVPYTSTGGDAHTGEFTLTIGDIPALSAAGCADGTFVDTTANPRNTGSDNDLVEDCQALVAAQNHWAGVSANSDLRSSYFLRTWGTGTAEQRKIDMWEGVTVSGGRVTALEIDNLGEEDGISGTIPAELGDLAALALLDISSHQLNGSIPTALGSLTALTSLDLSGNALSSEIPAQIGSLAALTSLDLSRNSLSGNIPTTLGSLTALTSLDLSSNSLSGTIPAQLGSLVSLTGLYLGGNELTGDIPAQLGSLSALVSLFLGGNRLTGSVPSQLGAITTLASLGVCGNYLTGVLPSALRSGVALLGYDTSDGYDPVACQTASDIQFSAPEPADLVVSTNGMLTIDAAGYATDGRYAISCSNATGVSASLSQVALAANTCEYTITAGPTAGTGDFTVPYESSGGDTHNGEITVTIAAISFTAPSGLKTGRNRALRIDASNDASHPGNTVSCGAPENIDTDRLMSVAQQGSTCEYIVTPISSLASSLYGDATFEVVFSSSGGVSVRGTYTIEIGPDSTISFSAPSLRIGRNLTLEIDVMEHADEVSPSDYTISCGAATGVVSSRLEGVTRTGDSCVFTIDPVDTLAESLQGDTTFTVPLSSTGGHARDAEFTVNIGPDSGITVTPPSSIAIAASRSRTIDFSGYATEDSPAAYAISCAAPTTASALITIGTPDGCSAEITSGADQGQATVSVEFSSSGGATATGSFIFDVGAASDIDFRGPPDLKVGYNLTRTINALAYAEDGGYPISCGTATGVNPLITAERITSGDGCSYIIDPVGTTQGTASFTVPYVSDGGDTHDGEISIEIGPVSAIGFSAPVGLRVARNRTLAIDALARIMENPAYTVTCADATGADPAKFTVARSMVGDGCSFTVDPADDLDPADLGSVSFDVVFTSNGGATTTGTFTVSIGHDSVITYQPLTGLRTARNYPLAIDASNAVSETPDSGYTISCSDAAGIHVRLASVDRAADSCSYTVTPEATATAGPASFDVVFTSDGGDSRTETITLDIGPDSDISYMPPTGADRLLTGSNRALEIDVAGFVSDGDYAISCEDASNVHPRLASVARGTGCVFTATPAGVSGSASFRVPVSSDGGHTRTVEVSLTIGPASEIVFTTPNAMAPSGLAVGVNRSRTINALGYVSDGNYDIT